jgi:hypothetical protein
MSCTNPITNPAERHTPNARTRMSNQRYQRLPAAVSAPEELTAVRVRLCARNTITVVQTQKIRTRRILEAAPKDPRSCLKALTVRGSHE